MKYRRLPGKKRSLGSWRTLWLGDDHLLSVDSNGYTEEYTRYYFKDIKAFYTRRTAGGKIRNALLAAVFAVFLLAFLTSLGDEAVSWTATMAVISALLLAALLANVLRGPTCRCHVLMPLGIHELPTLRRIRSVQRTLDLIRPRIEGFQGALTPEEAQVPADQFPSHPLPTRADAVPRDERPFPAYRGGAHLAAFSLLIGEAVLGFASLRFHDRLFLIVSGLLTLALFACLVTAVVKQHASPVPRLAGGLVWVAIGGLAIVITCGYYVGIILNAMNVRGNARPEMDMTGIVSVILSRPLFPYVAVVCSVCMAAVGTLGLLACLRGRGTPGVALPENADPLARDSVP